MPVPGLQFRQNAVQPPDQLVVRLAVELFFDQPLGGAPDHAGVVDDPGVPLKAVDGYDGDHTRNQQRCGHECGNDSLLHAITP